MACRQAFNQDSTQLGDEVDVRRLQDRRAGSVLLLRTQNGRKLFINSGATFDQLMQLLLPFGRFKWFTSDLLQSHGNCRRGGAVQTFHIFEMSKHSSQPHTGPLRDLLCARRQISFLDERQQRFDDTLLTIKRAACATVLLVR